MHEACDPSLHLYSLFFFLTCAFFTHIDHLISQGLLRINVISEFKNSVSAFSEFEVS
jgi:hypothetical protein